MFFGRVREEQGEDNLSWKGKGQQRPPLYPKLHYRARQPYKISWICARYLAQIQKALRTAGVLFRVMRKISPTRGDLQLLPKVHRIQCKPCIPAVHCAVN